MGLHAICPIHAPYPLHLFKAHRHRHTTYVDELKSIDTDSQTVENWNEIICLNGLTVLLVYLSFLFLFYWSNAPYFAVDPFRIDISLSRHRPCEMSTCRHGHWHCLHKRRWTIFVFFFVCRILVTNLHCCICNALLSCNLFLLGCTYYRIGRMYMYRTTAGVRIEGDNKLKIACECLVTRLVLTSTPEHYSI